jgi:hypothetical protein
VNNRIGRIRPARGLISGALLTAVAGCGGYGSGSNMQGTTTVTVTGAEMSMFSSLSTIGSTLDPTDYGPIMTKTDVIYFTDDTSNTVMLLPQ